MNDITKYNQIFQNAQHIHFTGIGGISMSALAMIAKNLGKKVTGSDINESDAVRSLRANGIPVFIGHTAENAVNCDLLVYTAAVKDNNPELVYVKTNNIPHFERATLLGLLMLQYKKSIAVSGTHGKTTTTSMLASIFMQSKADPTVLVGATLQCIGGNYRVGEGDVAIYEACEYCNSFWNFFPHTAIILNIDEDHLDFFKDIDDIVNSFVHFCGNIAADGHLIINGEDPQSAKVIQNISCPITRFGFSEDCDIYAENIQMSSLGSTFEVVYKGQKLGRLQLNVPGRHNILNALSATAAAFLYGISFTSVAEGLAAFRGADRRFQKKGSLKGADVLDDYAHHPTEIRATIAAAKQAGYKHVCVIFQPHTFTRTKLLHDEFADALKTADQVILTDIYSAREINTIGANILDLRDAIKGSQYIGAFADIAAYIQQNAAPESVFILMGAGSINQVASLLPFEDR